MSTASPCICLNSSLSTSAVSIVWKRSSYVSSSWSSAPHSSHRISLPGCTLQVYRFRVQTVDSCMHVAHGFDAPHPEREIVRPGSSSLPWQLQCWPAGPRSWRQGEPPGGDKMQDSNEPGLR